MWLFEHLGMTIRGNPSAQGTGPFLLTLLPLEQRCQQHQSLSQELAFGPKCLAFCGHFSQQNCGHFGCYNQLWIGTRLLTQPGRCGSHSECKSSKNSQDRCWRSTCRLVSNLLKSFLTSLLNHIKSNHGFRSNPVRLNFRQIFRELAPPIWDGPKMWRNKPETPNEIQ